jgi:hypothetical protein
MQCGGSVLPDLAVSTCKKAILGTVLWLGDHVHAHVLSGPDVPAVALLPDGLLAHTEHCSFIHSSRFSVGRYSAYML